MFVNVPEVSILGTGTEELALGTDEVKDLVKGDWEYWGDVKLDFENAYISIFGESAQILAKGSVSYSFEDSESKYENYVKFVKANLDDRELMPKQKLTLINWALALAFHQRPSGKREYLWPLALSGVLVKECDKWKFTHIQFSIPKANFPDERFENHKDFINSYQSLNDKINDCKINQTNKSVTDLLIDFQKEIIRSKDISKEIIEKYFTKLSTPCIISLKGQYYEGIDRITEFFNTAEEVDLNFDMEHLISHRFGEITLIIAHGILIQKFSENEIIQRSLVEMKELAESCLSSEEKIFAVKRSAAYALKESASGKNYSSPIRMTATILTYDEVPAFNYMHFSFPFYWIFEGKLDGVK